MQAPSVMLFAAGFGTRMGELTRNQPKPLIRVAGKPLIDHALDLTRAAGCRRPVVNLHYLGQQIADYLAGQDIALSWERTQILDTGGGLRAALPLLGPGPVMTLNSDAVWAGPNPLTALIQAWDPDRMDALLLLAPIDRAIGHAGRGDFQLGPDQRIARAAGGPGLVYLGAQILRTDLLAEIPDRVFSLNLVWDRLIAGNRAFGLAYPGHWCDVGHPQGIALAEAMLSDFGNG